MEVRDIVQETGIKTIPMEKKCKKEKWLSGEALQIAVKRREVKSKGEKGRYKHLNAEFRRIAKIAAIAGIIAIGAALVMNWDTICQWAGDLKTRISTEWAETKENMSRSIGEMKQNALDKFEAIKTGISDRITDAKEKVHDMIEKMKSFFNFSWELPKLKMPHVTFSGKFSINPPSAPTFKIDWWAKGYENPYLFTRPTILNGFGDRGTFEGGEMVYSRNRLLRDIESVTGRNSNRTFNLSVTVNAAEGMDENALAEMVAEKINDRIAREEGVFA